MMEESAVIKALSALAQPNRLRVFRQLIVAGKQGMTPGALGEAFEVAPATLSFHLKELLNAGLVLQERDGRNLIYRAQVENMNGLLAYLTDNCCQGEPCLDTTIITCKC
jgi:DNA-binding transcriptional ArsR family regulator